MTTPPSEADAALCVAPGCRRHPTAGWQLCRGHAAKLGQWLADIEDLYATLDATLSMATDWNSAGGHALASERSPARLDVVVMRDPRSRERDDADRDSNTGRGVLEVLGSWATTIRDERGLTPGARDVVHRRTTAPAGPVCDPWLPPCGHDTCQRWTWRGTAPIPATVTSERGVLVAHLDWAMGQDWAGDLYREIRQVWGLLKAAHGERAPKPQARCWVPQPDGSLCGGPIWTDPGAAWCGTCRTSWTGLDLLRISPVLSGAA